MSVFRSLGTLFFVLGAGCGKAPASKPKPSPASAAGTSSASGPGLPEGFSGTVRNSIDLDDEQRAATEEANKLSAARAEHARIRTSLRSGR